MSNTGRRMDFKGRKIVGGISVYRMAQIEQLNVRQWIQEAFQLKAQSNIQK